MLHNEQKLHTTQDKTLQKTQYPVNVNTYSSITSSILLPRKILFFTSIPYYLSLVLSSVFSTLPFPMHNVTDVITHTIHTHRHTHTLSLRDILFHINYIQTVSNPLFAALCILHLSLLHQALVTEHYICPIVYLKLNKVKIIFKIKPGPSKDQNCCTWLPKY